MSNIIKIDNKYAFHPGYYIKEYIEEMGYTQEDFAKRLDTTPKNISLLIRGEQKLSVDIAIKLSRLIGTSVKYWLNLQAEYDSLTSAIDSNKEFEKEKELFKMIDYNYFKKYFKLPDLPRRIDEQIKEVRKYLGVSTLCVFEKVDYNARFRSSSGVNESNIIKANIMVQIATNLSLKKNEMPKYNKKKFVDTIDYILTLTNKQGFYKEMKKALYDSGVDLIVLPNMPGSKINGATKIINDHVLLMVDDRLKTLDSFWFTLFHEIGHIINGDYGISFENDSSESEEKANKYAEDMLIDHDEYLNFISKKNYSCESIIEFANKINRSPGIIVGRLQNDQKVSRDNWTLNQLKQKFHISINNG